MGDTGVQSMNIANPLSSAEIGKSSETEIERDIHELARGSDGDRIQREITEYTDLSQHVMQLTTIISESVKKLPGTSGTRH